MKTKRWLAWVGSGCMAASWIFEFGGWPDPVVTKWFLASCIFFAAWSVAAHIDERDDQQ